MEAKPKQGILKSWRKNTLDTLEANGLVWKDAILGTLLYGGLIVGGLVVIWYYIINYVFR